LDQAAVCRVPDQATHLVCDHDGDCGRRGLCGLLSGRESFL